MKKLLTFGIAALLIACDDNDSASTGSKITIETREVLEPASRRLTFFCKTQKIYPCANIPILTEKQIDEASFKITFTSVGETSLCLTATGPATTSVDLNTLRNGEFEIELNNAYLKNKGTLKVTDTEIELLFDQENGIEIVRPNTKRVPGKTYWGTIGYHVQSSSVLADEFIQKFVAQGAAFNKQTPGNYFYYDINSAGDIVSNVESSGYYFLKAFIFQYDGDESALKNLIEVDGKNYKKDLSISVQTYKGEQINNWGN
jgi:hypothetical protein